MARKTNKPTGSPTIRALAKLAGVSTATVSLALRNHPRISPEVRERIQKIANKAGYQTNAVVANLLAQVRASKSTSYQSTLGLISISKPFGWLKESTTFSQWIIGCEKRAASLGYALDPFSLVEQGIAPKRLVEILKARNIRGLLVIGSDLGFAEQPELDPIWEYAAAVVLGVQLVSPALSFASNDQFHTVQVAIQEVLKLGYKRPGLCIDPEINAWINNRFSGGFFVGVERLPLKQRVPVFGFDAHAEKRFRSWVKTHRPDVILTLHMQIPGWLKAMRLRIPEDIGLVHIDKYRDLAWAGVEQNHDKVGTAAVDMIVGAIHRNEYGIPAFQRGMYISSTWVPGPTVRAQ